MCLGEVGKEDDGPQTCQFCDPDNWLYNLRPRHPSFNHLLYHIYVKHPDYALELCDGDPAQLATAKTRLGKFLGM